MIQSAFLLPLSTVGGRSTQIGYILKQKNVHTGSKRSMRSLHLVCESYQIQADITVLLHFKRVNLGMNLVLKQLHVNLLSAKSCRLAALFAYPGQRVSDLGSGASLVGPARTP